LIVAYSNLAKVEEQADLLDFMARRPVEAFGPDYDPYQDGWRLGRQGLCVFNALKSGDWKTLPEIGDTVPGLSSAHSARIRNIREWMHEKGLGTIEKRQREGAPRGNIEYRMVRK